MTTLSAQSVPAESPSEAMAEVHGEKISRADLLDVAGDELERLRLEGLQFEASQNRKRQEILENHLKDLVADRLLALDAEARGIALAELLEAEVDGQVEEPSEEDVEVFYASNRSRLQGNREQLLPLIRDYLLQQKKAEKRQQLVDTLGEKYGVSYHLEPLRIKIGTRGHPAAGPADAPVTIVEFSDFECPFCSAMYGTIKDVQENYGQRVRLVFRQFPLNRIHPNAQKAAEAALCAHDQDQFWKLHDLMFADQKSLGVEDLQQKAGELGLDTDTFEECLASGKYADRVKQDLDDGTAAGVSGTPALFVNGRPLIGNVPYQELARIIDEELGAE